MVEVVKQVLARQDEFIADPHTTFRELEIVRQTLIVVEKMKKNGKPHENFSDFPKTSCFFRSFVLY